MKKRIACLVVLAAIAVAVAGGCSSGDGDGIPGDANLAVYLTDAPMDGVQAVNVTIDAVSVHQSADAGPGDAGWRDIPVTAPMPVDLLRLRGGVLLPLCGVRLGPGHYQQVRLEIRQNTGDDRPYHNSVVDAGGVRHPLEVPSDIKIVHQFTVADGTRTDLTLDFRAGDSMRRHGNGGYFMQPVIHASTRVR